MTIYNNVLEMIGETPILKLNHLDTGPCELYVKLECNNPGGSIKDRIALSMIEAAEKSGALKPGDTIVEGSAGNTALGLAFVAAAKGYKLLVVIPDKMSQAKVIHLKALGAEVIITRSDVVKGHPEYYQDYAARIAEENGYYFINQFANPANPQAHEETTGPEIWSQMQEDVDVVVCGVGSSGTLTGMGRYLKKVSPNIEIVLADPVGSVVANYIQTGELGEAKPWMVEGIGEDFIPSICDLSLVDEAYSISDKESFQAARELLQKEGVLAGPSAGTMLATALRYCQKQTTKKKVLTLICDSGNKYLNKMFNDYWMLDNGFVDRSNHGDLRDIISRHYDEHAIVALGPEEPLNTALKRMKLHDISQLPVLEDGKVIGMLDESDVLVHTYQKQQSFDTPVKDIMASSLELIDYQSPIENLLPIFEKGYVAIVMQDDKFLGIITRIDLINYLRQKQQQDQ